MKTLERVAEYFASHPEAKECYEALGKVFAEKEKAQAYLGGVAGRLVTTHSKGDGQSFERESDRLRYEIAQQNNVINDKHLAYENATAIEKEQFMGEWNAAKQVLLKLEHRLYNQLSMEEKDELLAKEDKNENTVVNPELTVDQLKEKVAVQQVIVDSNIELVNAAPKNKKAKIEKAAQADKKLLADLQGKLKVAEEKVAKQLEASTEGTDDIIKPE